MIKYSIKRSNNFKRQYKKILKQGKDISKMEKVIEMLASGEQLNKEYKDHSLNDNKYYRGCREYHIESDWLLIYKIINNELILTYLICSNTYFKLFNIPDALTRLIA